MRLDTIELTNTMVV